MKAIHDGILFDTGAEDVTLIASWDNGYYESDFRMCTETLHRTEKGRWFLRGEGGPLTQYAEDHGNTKSAGENIIPMCPEEVMEWLERRQMVKRPGYL